MTTALPFGLRDVKLTPILADGTLGTIQDLPYGRVLSFSEAEDYTDLRGDDATITTHGSGPSVEWSLESGGIEFAAYKILSGSTITTSGTGTTLVTTIRKLVSDIRPFFKAEGQAISDSGGDFHTVLYRCRCTGNLEGEMSDGDFWITKASGKAFPSQAAGQTDWLYEFKQNATATAIT